MLTRLMLQEVREAARDSGSVRVLAPDGAGGEREEYLIPWASGLTFKEQCRQEDQAWDEAERLWTRLDQLPESAELHRVGEAYMVTIGAQIEATGNPAVFRRYRRQQDLDIELIAAVQFKQILDVVFNRSYLDFSTGLLRKLLPQPYLRPIVAAHRVGLQRLPVPPLEKLHEPADEWYRSVALAHYLCPDLALLGVTYRFWHPPPAPGLGDRYRQVATASGSSRATEDAALKAKRQFHAQFGIAPHREKPGPKKGQPNARVAHYQQFDALVMDLTKRDQKPYQIAQNPRARELYGRARGERETDLRLRDVQASIRRTRGKS